MSYTKEHDTEEFIGEEEGPPYLLGEMQDKQMRAYITSP